MKILGLILFGVIFILSSCSTSDLKDESSGPDRFERLFFGELKLIDLTHSLSATSPYWPGSEGSPFHYDTLGSHEDGAPSFGGYSTYEHFGTHLDAPVHFAAGQVSVDKIPIESFFGPAVVIDVAEKCSDNPDYLLSVADLEAWESSYGEIPIGAIVLMNTGWASKWDDMNAYRNMDEEGKMHFPGFSPEAGKFLIDNRNINGIGIDNLSVDAGYAKGFPAHDIVNGAGKYHLENVGDLSGVTSSGAYLIVAPIKLEGGSGGQVRIFAVVP